MTAATGPAYYLVNLLEKGPYIQEPQELAAIFEKQGHARTFKHASPEWMAYTIIYEDLKGLELCIRKSDGVAIACPVTFLEKMDILQCPKEEKYSWCYERSQVDQAAWLEEVRDIFLNAMLN